MLNHRTPRALPRIGSALGTALALLALSGDPAHAAAGASLYGEGLHISTGALVDPAGRTWVADHNGGFCRMTEPDDNRHSTIEHPSSPGGAGPRTCLGGLLPDAGTGPDAAGQPLFYDPTPHRANSGDELALIPDGASPSSEVVRAQWNPNTKLFHFKDTVTMLADRGRPTVLSLGPDNAVYVGFQRETSVQRIVDPAAIQPRVEIVGATSDGDSAQTLAAGQDANGDTVVYLGEAGGLTVLRNPSTAVPTAEPAGFELDPLAPIGAMYYDLADHNLYLGGANGDAGATGTDAVTRVDTRTGAVDPAFATGFSMIGGLAERPDGNLYVLDDPALLDPAEPMGTGRLFHVGLPAAHVGAGPLAHEGIVGRDRNTRDTTPTFTISGDGAIECRITGNGVNTGWVECDTTFTAPELAHGAYTLSVRSEGGLPEHVRFTVDTREPLAPVIVRPGGTVSGNPWFEFTSEEGVEFACAFDTEEAFTPCKPGRTRGNLAAGEHTLRITATDRAGNESPVSTAATFTVDPSLPITTAPGWGEGPPISKGSSLFAGGLHISTGALVDPNGRTWIADHNGGFCRVTQPNDDGPGTIDHPAVAGDPGPRTCLGGLMPEAGIGPDAAGQPVFVDPTPELPGSGDEIALIPDGASPSQDVVRTQWNPDTGLFEFKDIVAMTTARSRPVAATLGADGAVYVVFQRSGTVERINNPAGTTPTVDVVGTVLNGRRAGAIAAGRDGLGRTILYIAEDTGITQLDPNAALRQTARLVDLGLGADAPLVGAMAYDLKRDHLYLGTAIGTRVGEDAVHRVHVPSGQVETDWVTGYSMIGGLAVRPDGVVYVLDDPALLDPAEPMGTGRLFHVGLPAAHIAVGARAFVDTATPAFGVSGEGVVECRLSGPAGIISAFAPCATDVPWTPAAPLLDGQYRLAVRSVVTPEATEEVPAPAPVVGLVEVHAFTVDTVRPATPEILSPANGAVVGASPWFTFAGEEGARFRCSWDGGAFEPCEPGLTRTFTENDGHTLAIRSVDQAGNASRVSARVAFTAMGVIEAIRITGGPEAVTRANDVTFAFASDAVDVQYDCRIDARAFTACVDTQRYTGLADGDHTFEVQGRDAFGNVSTASRSFRVDRTAPVITTPGIGDGAVTGPNVSIALGLNEGATVTCALDGAALPAGSVCGNTVTLAGLTVGVHTLAVTATDAVGNVSTLTRRFTVQAVAPVLEPEEPAITVIDQASGQPLTIRFADIDRRVDLQKLQEAGVTVQVVPAQGTKLIRFRIFKLSGNGRNRGGRAVAVAASAKRTVVATIYRRVKGGRSTTITLTRKELRRITAGRYVLEVTPGRSKRDLGKAKTARFTVIR